MKCYKTFILSDEPKIFGIPIITGLPVITLTLLGVLFDYAFQCFIVGGATSFVMHLKFGGIPIRQFWGIVYWKLPRPITFFLFQKSPDSANRLYIR